MCKRLLLRRWVVYCIVALVGVFGAAAQGDMLTFYCLTNNNPGDAAIGVAQLRVEVTQPESGYAYFEFRNLGPEDSSITDVYWDNGSLMMFYSLVDADDGVGGDLGVDFSFGGSPRDLPDGNNAVPPFNTTEDFLADSDAPVRPTGVDPGEWLGAYYTIDPGASFADVLDELTTGQLRIGLRMQGYASLGSESFINNPLPEPATMTLLSLGGLALLRRRKS